MSKGVLLFALNNAEIDYIKLAEDAARRVHKFLNVPVSVVTDSDSANTISDKTLFDNVILVDNESYHLKRFHDGEKTAKAHWKNSHRNSSFELSPYDDTLVIDVDYVVNSDVLSYCWDQPHDFLIYKSFFDIGQRKDVSEFTYISDYSIPFYWATVFFFRKSEETKIFFDLIDHIRENWVYYKLLYRFNTSIYRNDHAFSIAIHVMNGYCKSGWAKPLPGRLLYTIDKDVLVNMSDTDFLFLIEKEKYQGEYTVLKTKNVNVHIMNKFSIGRLLNV